LPPEMREKMSKKRTQIEQVLSHLKKKKTITSWQAIERYHITRLAHYIYVLKEHYRINTIIEKADGHRWAKYIYQGEK
jgi:hypothetical protein